MHATIRNKISGMHVKIRYSDIEYDRLLYIIRPNERKNNNNWGIKIIIRKFGTKISQIREWK